MRYPEICLIPFCMDTVYTYSRFEKIVRGSFQVSRYYGPQCVPVDGVGKPSTCTVPVRYGNKVLSTDPSSLPVRLMQYLRSTVRNVTYRNW